jgi:hypothetical protein
MKLPTLKKSPRRLSLHSEYKHLGMLRLLTLFIMGVFVLGAFQTALFLYENVYGSIQRAEAIVVLRSEIGVEAIDFEEFRRITRNWDQKYATTTVKVARDPFTAVPLPAATSTAQ